MKTIQMTIDETLLEDVDRAVDEIGTNRSLFIRNALQSALRRHAVEKLEARHAAGYAKFPASQEGKEAAKNGDEYDDEEADENSGENDEVAEWVDEQVWGDA